MLKKHKKYFELTKVLLKFVMVQKTKT